MEKRDKALAQAVAKKAHAMSDSEDSSDSEPNGSEDLFDSSIDEELARPTTSSYKKHLTPSGTYRSILL